MSELLHEEREAGPLSLESRQGGIRSSIFTLVSTMMGGGVLSLPFAVQKTGIVLAPVLLIGVCLISRFSLWLVLTTGCSVRASSYEDMAALTLGRRASTCVTFILIFLLWFVIVAYSILLGDLLGPVLAFCFRSALDEATVRSHAILSLRTATMVLAHVVLFPVTSSSSISAMRFTSAISLSTTSLLAVLISVRSIATMISRGSFFAEPAPLAPRGGLLGALSGSSIFAVSFLCHFNLLPVSEELARPTKLRFRKVVDRTTAFGGALYLIVGMLGVAEFSAAPGGVRGNILLNYPCDDVLISLGRLGLALTVSIGIALMVHPMRSAIRTLLPPSCVPARGKGAQAEPEGAQGEPAPYRGAREVLEAFLIQSSGLVVAIFIPEITVVWSFMGSTVCMLIGYVIPGACYLGLRNWGSQQSLSNWMGAWALVVGGSVLTVVCTYITVVEYFVHPT